MCTENEIEEAIKKASKEGRVLVNESYGKDNDPSIITTEDMVDQLNNAINCLKNDYLRIEREVNYQFKQLWNCMELLTELLQTMYRYFKGENLCQENKGCSEPKSPSLAMPEASKKL